MRFFFFLVLNWKWLRFFHGCVWHAQEYVHYIYMYMYNNTFPPSLSLALFTLPLLQMVNGYPTKRFIVWNSIPAKYQEKHATGTSFYCQQHNCIYAQPIHTSWHTYIQTYMHIHACKLFKMPVQTEDVIDEEFKK